ncbi:MAG: septal ring lytic transglycosylase RlpA family protein [Deltaproteobacteria bacterium]
MIIIPSGPALLSLLTAAMATMPVEKKMRAGETGIGKPHLIDDGPFHCFEPMKGLFLLSLVCVLAFPACARYAPPSHPVSAPPRVLTLPGTAKVSKPYVVNGVRYHPLPDAYGFVEYGKASWYGKEFHGRPTSSGEIYNMYGKTAAHKLLPLDTVVKVTNLANQKTILLPVNDRGPFVKGRVIDLSYGAAMDLDMIGPGVVDVKVEALAREVANVKGRDGFAPLIEVQDFRRGEFTVQVGAFENQQNALRLAERLRESLDEVRITVYEDARGKTFHRVQASKSETLDQAEAMERKLEAMGFADAFKVRMEAPR